MPIHSCPICHQIFKRKEHLTNHLNKKNPCINKYIINQQNQNTLKNTLNLNENIPKNDLNLGNQNFENLPENNQILNQMNFADQKMINSETLNYYLNDNKCVYCKKEFTCKPSVLRHLRGRCKEKKKIEEGKVTIFNELKSTKEEVEYLKGKLENKNKEMDEIKMLLINNNKDQGNILNNNDNSTNHTENNTHNGDNINQTFNLISYGKEDLNQIDPKLIQKSANKVYAAPLYITDAIHFNEKFPEFHNIYIPNMRDKYAMKYFDGRWNLVDRNDLIDEIYEDKKTLIEENLNKFVENLTENKKRRLIEWIENETNNKAEGTIKVKEELKLLLYNKRDMVINRKNQIEKNKKLK